ncbi:MAG: divalent-cation tolerance protein CutA [Acidobacteria bacterium]|nr:divalent-cation tolerance protein CutA [Acidobacteriota bacterium]
MLTTWPADQPVEAFVRGMVEARLAACVHVSGAGRSIYRWEGAIEEAAEQQLIIKTTRGRLAALGAYVRGAHPYTVPEWLEFDAAGSDAYAAWIAASISG